MLISIFITGLFLGSEPPAISASKLPPDAPLEFRCANMQVTTGPNRTLCRGDVVIRRGDLWVCCQKFEGFADANWEWQRFVCSEDVRAERGIETMWAKQAEFIMATSVLTLTGEPKLKRGLSLMRGAKVIVHTNEDRARIEKPSGIIETATGATVTAAKVKTAGPLPDTCPILRFSK